MINLYKHLKKYIKNLSNLNLFFWLTFWLMIILTIGTIAQKDIGLYQAQIKYFNSWYFWIGPVPLPSARPVLGFILLGLISQLLFKTKFLNYKKIGISIAHLGAVLLLLGAVITSYLSEEGSMIIPEGDTINYMLDYHQLELVITEKENPANVITIHDEKLIDNSIISAPSIPFKIKLINYFVNSKFENRKPGEDSRLFIGFAKRFKIVEELRSTEDSDNQAAVNFEINSNNNNVELYSIVQNMPVPQTITFNKKTYMVELRNKRTYLPFSIHLVSFEKTFHPSTNLPKSFKSTVYLIDGNIKQKNIIQMNEPLRYKNYTFYQSSFSEGKIGKTTNLAVVKNYGRIFPYLSSIILCFGLLIHLFINSTQLFKKYNEVEKL